MTDKETPAADSSAQNSSAQVAYTFLALIAAPILALITAIMGIILVLNDRTVAGVIFILVPTQLFVALGLWANNKRKATNEPSE